MKIFVKKEKYVLSFWGWGVLLSLTSGIFIFFIINAHSFLAYHHPIEAQVLIVEGWVPDYALEETAKQWNQQNYQNVVTTGGPLYVGSFLSQYKTYAELSGATLQKLGIDKSKIIVLPAPIAERNRTITSALEVKMWLMKHPEIKYFNLLTLGVHARRSYMLYRNALPPTVELGVIAVQSKDYDPEKWWYFSAGVRNVIFEGIAYFYFILRSSFVNGIALGLNDNPNT